MPVSQLPAAEIARRIKAARELRQVSQNKLAGLMAKDGISKTDLGKIERCDKKVVLRLVHQEAILRHLQLPERWLTEPDLDVVVGYEDVAGVLDQILDAVKDWPEDITRQIQVAFDDYAQRLGPQIGKLPQRSRRSPDRRREGPPAAA